MTKIAAVDVAVLAQAIQQMDTGAQALSTHCASLSGQFAKYGLDTENLRRLSAIASWTRDQLPDLRRRHALAVHIGAGATTSRSRNRSPSRRPTPTSSSRRRRTTTRPASPW